MSLQYVRRGMCCAVLISLLSALAACSSAPKQDSAAAQLAVQQKVNERLAAADEALKSGHQDLAVEQLDQAIKTDPAAKQPWLKKAQVYFEGRQYGLAITAAHEVLQRDVSDLTAKSILAVSGLRVSADALEQLRKVNEVKGSARNEAESVARLIREALGEPILLPVAQPAPITKPRRRAARTVTPPAVLNLDGASNKAVAAVPVAPVAKAASASTAVKGAPSTSGRSNPFGALQ